MNARPVIRLRPKEGRRASLGAPWVYSNEIVMDAAAKALTAGSLVDLVDARGKAIGSGYFNIKSLIAVRLLAEPGAAIGRQFFADKLRDALRLRERLYDAPFYRLVHAEGDGLPGLVVDRFADVLVLSITTAGMEQRSDELMAALDDVLHPRTVVIRSDSSSRIFEGLESAPPAIRGEGIGRIVVEENRARYLADPVSGQKSGWYYDQRANRAFIAKLASGARVLDAYCYSGGFGVIAAKSGAADVTGLDSSDSALSLAEDSAALNGVAARCRFIKADVFAELERLSQRGERFDIVLCDPPPFARTRKDVEAGARAYRKLARLAAMLVSPGGFLMLSSCSYNVSRERFQIECAQGILRAGRRAALIRDGGAGPDHPVHPMLPETAYLKALVYAIGA